MWKSFINRRKLTNIQSNQMNRELSRLDLLKTESIINHNNIYGSMFDKDILRVRGFKISGGNY